MVKHERPIPIRVMRPGQSSPEDRAVFHDVSRDLPPPILVAGVVALLVAVTLSGCGSSAPRRDAQIERPPSRISKAPSTAPSSAPAPRGRRGGGYYLDDGPGDSPPQDLESIPDAVPRPERLHRGAMRPYVVMGQSYTPMTELTPYRARGVASWYGRRYHGKQTSSGEIYDMYGMTAAHPVLPLPSYVRVTNVATGKSVVVRVNDRGPFIDSRLIDLSYTAAHRIGVLGGGSAVVEVETILHDAGTPVTAIASASRPAVVATRPPMPQQQPAAVAPASSPAPDPSSQPDPILAIAAAARDPVPQGRPLAAPAAEEAPVPAAGAPTVSADASPVPAQRGTTPDSGGVYLQLGAFGSRENAESYLARARSQVEWIAQRLHLFPRDGMYRVHAGPYSSPTEARVAAERIALALGTRPVVVIR